MNGYRAIVWDSLADYRRLVDYIEGRSHGIRIERNRYGYLEVTRLA